MKVYVIMGNDYPNCVFADHAEAEAYVKARMDDPANRFSDRPTSGRRVYWRSYEFDLQEKGTDK